MTRACNLCFDNPARHRRASADPKWDLTVTEPLERFGVFLVPAKYTADLEKAAAHVAALEYPEDDSVAPPAYRVAQHELFEQLLAASTSHRVFSFDAIDDFSKFTTSLDPRNRLAWEQAPPDVRLELFSKNLARMANETLRAALRELLAHDAGPHAGLWSIAEVALQPEPEPTEPSEDISPAEMKRRLIAYIAEQDSLEAERVRLRGPLRRAWVCELLEKDARGPANAMRAAALSCVAEEDTDFVDALESFCERAPVESISHLVYSSAQARDVLTWLESQRRSTTRTLMLRVLRPAVANKHAFAIVMEPTEVGLREEA